MNLINNIRYKIYGTNLYAKWYGCWYTFCENRANKKYLKKYPDYEINEYNEGSLKHIWGVVSWDDLSGHDSCLHTMNDIDITYDRDTKKYMLGIETAYIFKDEQAECKYLRQLLDVFTDYMDKNNLNKNERYFLFFHNPEISFQAKSIEELYTHFKIFVDGYCSFYNYNNPNS